MRRAAFATLSLVPVLLLGGYLATYGHTTTTVAEVERDVERGLPVGSSRHEIESWLAIHGIEFSFAEEPGSVSTVLAAVPDIGRYPSVVTAIVRDTDRSLWVTGSIQLYVLLGADDRLQKTIVRWVGTGP